MVYLWKKIIMSNRSHLSHISSTSLGNILGSSKNIKSSTIKRLCKKKGCKQKLSVYNMNEYCFIHQREVKSDE